MAQAVTLFSKRLKGVRWVNERTGLVGEMVWPRAMATTDIAHLSRETADINRLVI